MAGFAAYVFQGEDPLLLSFEDPDDMAKKQNWLKEEITRRAKARDAYTCQRRKFVPSRRRIPRTLSVVNDPLPGKILERGVSIPSCCRDMKNFFL